MKSLITGIDGFIGYHLTQALRARGDEVYGLSREPAGERNGATIYHVDVADSAAVTEAIAALRPELIFHLAAQSNIPRSFMAPQETMTINLNGSLNLFSAAQQYTPEATIISAGSSAEYGRGDLKQTQISEDSPLLPSNPYGISKVAQGMAVALYARSYGMRLIHVRPFAVIGPGKTGDVVADFCQAVIRIQQQQLSQLITGNRQTIRDFIDIRDCVQALLLLSIMWTLLSSAPNSPSPQATL